MSIHSLFHWLPTALRIKTKILQDPDDLTHFSSRIPNPQHLSSSHTDVFFKCLRAFTTPKGTEALHMLLPLPALHSTHFPHLPLLSVPSDRNSVFTASGTVFHFPESLSSLTPHQVHFLLLQTFKGPVLLCRSIYHSYLLSICVIPSSPPPVNSMKAGTTSLFVHHITHSA